MTKRKAIYWLKRSWAFVLCGVVLGCGLGGGGGGGDGQDVSSAPPPDVNLSLDPHNIDAGDRTNLLVELTNVQINFILKVRFKKNLGYVTNSTFVKAADQTVAIEPDLKKSDATYTYLIYFLTPDQFFEEGEGKLLLQLQAKSDSGDTTISVDTDIDNPNISNSKEFDVNNPRFDVQSEDDVSVGEKPSSSSSSSSGSSSSSSSSG
jgi:hypothetical protein